MQDQILNMLLVWERSKSYNRWKFNFRALMIICTLVGLHLTAIWSRVLAAELRSDKDGSLAEVLSTLEILDEEKLASGLVVRLFRTTYSGECDPHREAQTCPRSQLILILSLPEGGTESPVLWRTNRLIGWGLVRRFEQESTNATANGLEIKIEVKVCEAPLKVERGQVDGRVAGWWRENHYEIRVRGLDARMV